MSVCSFADLRKEAVELLARVNRLPQREFERKLHQIFVRDDVNGSMAVMHLLQQLLKISPAADADFWHAQIQACREAARVGHKVRRGWGVYGMTPWEVVHWQPPKQMARYNSEPVINGPREAPTVA